MRILKGFTQIKMNSDSDPGEIFSWYNEGTLMLVKTINNENPAFSNWEYDRVPGREHRNYNNFYLWFEYE